jgi:hypothetical protein
MKYKIAGFKKTDYFMKCILLKYIDYPEKKR